MLSKNEGLMFWANELGWRQENNKTRAIFFIVLLAFRGFEGIKKNAMQFKKNFDSLVIWKEIVHDFHNNLFICPLVFFLYYANEFCNLEKGFILKSKFPTFLTLDFIKWMEWSGIWYSNQCIESLENSCFPKKICSNLFSQK
jgi:hypothetical protein